MDKRVQLYNNNSSLSGFNKAASVAVSHIGQGIDYVDRKVFEANIDGRIWQLEADTLLVHKYGLPPRKKRW